MYSKYNVYELIEVLRFKKDMSSRYMAIQAGISPATLASIMSRRPPKIAIETLDKIASVFNVRWYELLNQNSSYADRFLMADRTPVAMTQDDIEAVGYKILGITDTMMYVEKAHERFQQRIEDAQTVVRYTADQQDMGATLNSRAIPVLGGTEEFRNSLFFVLNKLNDDGLMEAMRRILDVANDPKYCKIKETT